MGDSITALNLSDDLLKLRLENISRDARKTREKNRTFKQLYSDKEVNEYKLKLAKARQEAKGDNKYFMPETPLLEQGLESIPTLGELGIDQPLDEKSKQNINNDILSLSNEYEQNELLLMDPSKINFTDAMYTNINIIYNLIVQLGEIVKNIKLKLDRPRLLLNSLETDEISGEDFINQYNDNIDQLNSLLSDYADILESDEFDQFVKSDILQNNMNYNIIQQIPKLPKKTDLTKITKEKVKRRSKKSKTEEQPSVEQPSVEQPSVEQPSVEQPELKFPLLNIDINKIKSEYVNEVQRFGESLDYFNIDNIKEQLDQTLETQQQLYIQTLSERQDEIRYEIERLQNDLKKSDEDEKTYEANVLKVKRDNKEKLRVFRERFNELNRGEAQLEEQQPDETEQDYLDRISQGLTGQANDDDEYEVLSKLDTLNTLKDNLKLLITDESKIMEVIKDLDENTRFEINKIFPSIKDKFLKKYGFNNKQVSSTDIVNYLKRSFMGELETEVALITSELGLEEFDTTEKLYGIYDDTVVVLNIGSFKINNKPNNPEIYYHPQINVPGIVDPTDLNNIDERWLREQIKPGIFNKLMFDEYSDPNIKEIKGKLNDIKTKLGEDSPLMSKYSEVLPPNIFIPSARAKKLFYVTLQKLGLKGKVATNKSNSLNSPYVQNNYSFQTVTGMGIANKYNIPKEPVKYGKIYINLDKLYYKNILSIKDEKGGQIQSMKNTPVSDDFVNYVLKGFVNEPVSELDYKKIRSSELELLDQLNYLAGFAKEKNINKTNHIDKLKNELELITGSITAGNNNKKLLDDLRNVLMKLTSFDAISMTNAQKYYNQFKDQF